ncbi:hypothetical protein [Thermocrispum municipale]|uniref:hypothetical protein n=1 Tax=Thermocrispum municipale TaxID=37926 RepID=UPI000427EEF4|nr:hypothetical protein [Thermocrispum municipale]
MTALRIDDPAQRENLAAFVARAVRLDAQVPVRMRVRDGGGVVEAWATTPFEVLATRAVRAELTPSDVTVSGNELLAALTVVRSDEVDPGPARDLLWRAELPPQGSWPVVDDVPVSVVSDLTERGLTVAKENAGPMGNPPASLLEQPVLTVSNGQVDLKVPMRCLFALAGMGFTGQPEEHSDDVVRVRANDSWLRIDARFGAVVRRRHALLPLVF